ncbi:amidoligase family protein [Pseudomonas benzenivorans]|uniref:Amidoligase family protein n=1 Tax=Pseudomonas benzenivorans TaxID=556533 RepID=A0ABY5HAF5_9PSED|nr:amidoligase family protein [Pseudomonas benzenivorans]UTW08797.1 amidoligase family protein [Pseudomonas benzenivorans]
MPRDLEFKQPPVPHKEDGASRQVGFELEFTGLTLEQTAAAVQDALGGELSRTSASERVLRVDGLGKFNIELDWDLLKRQSLKAENAQEGSPEWMDLLSRAASLMVPLEVVCPPIDIGELGRLDGMIAGLRQAGAVGTENSPMAAFGVHLNPDIPRLDPATISAYLRAFGLLQWWLVDAHQVDLSRKISPYIDLYPEAYVRRLVEQPRPDMAQLFDDYLEHNATRNRALDLLPLLAQIDAERVRQAVPDPKIKARPTFHYRLPNCQIEKADWSLASSWNLWWVVEQLAGNEDDLQALGEAFGQHWRPLLGLNRGAWLEYVGRWLNDRGWG